MDQGSAAQAQGTTAPAVGCSGHDGSAGSGLGGSAGSGLESHRSAAMQGLVARG